MKDKKKFDAVKMMREIRDNLSEEFKNMDFEEQKNYIEESVKSKTKGKQREKNKAEIYWPIFLKKVKIRDLTLNNLV